MRPESRLLLGAALALCYCAASAAGVADTGAAAARKGKLSIFNVVRFPNDPCEAAGNRNGTCYTADECEDRDGTNSGSCANGYGVCCTFTLGCGGMSRENCTYFESANMGGGTCRASICMKENCKVCQLRLDFNTFVITGPSTSTNSYVKQTFGVISPVQSKTMTTATQCNTDRFQVTNPGGESSPVLCGTNSGEHMYMPASDACNDLVFQMNSPSLAGNGGVGGTFFGTANSASTRMWSIKVTQIACDDENKAPFGCLQYFYGSGSGTVRSYNYEGGSHLADQDQNICIRRERGNCRICWAAVDAKDVMLSGMTATMGFTTQSQCCGYTMAGAGTKGYDCIIIPGALTSVSMMKIEGKGVRMCGRSAGLVTAVGADPKTVCTDRVPFSIRFRSDEFEHLTEAALLGDVGFKLSYWQTSNGC